MTPDNEDTSSVTTFTMRLPATLRQAFSDLCDAQKRTGSQAMRDMMNWAVTNRTLPTGTTERDFVNHPSEEEIVTWIYKLLKPTHGNIGQQLDEIVLQLTRSHMVSEKFVYHCFGRMILAGVIRLDVG